MPVLAGLVALGGCAEPATAHRPGDAPNDESLPGDAAGDANLDDIPRFSMTFYIDLDAIKRISRFRSGIGHDFADSAETCRSMKHYFCPRGCMAPLPHAVPWTSLVLRAPVTGRVTRLDVEQTYGTQVHIEPAGFPTWDIRVFHVTPVDGLAVGTWSQPAIRSARMPARTRCLTSRSSSSGPMGSAWSPTSTRSRMLRAPLWSRAGWPRPMICSSRQRTAMQDAARLSRRGVRGHRDDPELGGPAVAIHVAAPAPPMWRSETNVTTALQGRETRVCGAGPPQVQSRKAAVRGARAAPERPACGGPRAPETRARRHCSRRCRLARRSP